MLNVIVIIHLKSNFLRCGTQSQLIIRLIIQKSKDTQKTLNKQQFNDYGKKIAGLNIACVFNSHLKAIIF